MVEVAWRRKEQWVRDCDEGRWGAETDRLGKLGQDCRRMGEKLGGSLDEAEELRSMGGKSRASSKTADDGHYHRTTQDCACRIIVWAHQRQATASWRSSKALTNCKYRFHNS